ncbi:hypothetical protein CPC08DRAFT_713593 [Agrocybe pediades]|nr:hypothetical protein CPC08DRAFT_713593 [Agrocybe pediades]
MTTKLHTIGKYALFNAPSSLLSSSATSATLARAWEREILSARVRAAFSVLYRQSLSKIIGRGNLQLEVGTYCRYRHH